MVPVTRLTLRIGELGDDLLAALWMAGFASARSVVMSRDLSRPWSCFCVQKRPTSGPTSGE
jgi:hypothetical protein